MEDAADSEQGRSGDLTGLPRRRFLVGMAAGAFLSGTGGARALAAGEELHFVHAFGETTLPKPAERVVSLGYTTQDPLLALGVRPVAIRRWFGSFPHGVWPWAQPLLGDAQPTMISGEVSMEVVAALAPDLIVGIGSGISEAEYAVLSQIAPVLMQPVGLPAYGMAWDELTRLLGRAVGRSARAEEAIAASRRVFADARARHPGWAGQTAVCAYNYGGKTGAFTGFDTRASFLAELGFRPPPSLIELADPNVFYTPLSPEDLSPLDADLLVWISSSDVVSDIVALPMRRTLRAHKEGREVLAGALVAGALSFGSVLSLPFALEQLEADIALALDADPATVVTSAAAAGLAP
ncbi:ABC transporter substrate-binding protein [Rhizobium sp. GN54]|uniref:ABC transporter substrate-binding protein n=1 Tax=Rhizobium sp. GN54 TaxID=2898150 RepID=UPI001E2EEE06|nr:ABC transporter substrate-binding protein [Rhizobium sp. GN54]MCD2182940.1 ABC transporter substrate-binding protein [Rhizobium sp. GN54]